MITIEISAHTLKAVQAVAKLAIKDSRYMLAGVYVDFTENMLVATNGHTLVAAPALISGVWNGIDSLILDLNQIKIPAKAVSCTISVSDTGDDIRIEFPFTALVPQLLTRIQDGQYPDWTRVTAASKGNTSNVEAIGVNPDYLVLVGKAIGHNRRSSNNCVGLKFFGEKSTCKQIKVLWSSEPDLLHVVMPCII